MLIRRTFIIVLIAFLGIVSFGNGQEDESVEVLLVDGPGGYLPDIGEEIDSSMDFSPPSIDDEGSISYMVVYGRLLDILSYWDSYIRLILG
jgi:hypothetical protein